MNFVETSRRDVSTLYNPRMPTLSSLRKLEMFTVTLKGTTMESFPSGASCIYFEWVYGEKRDGEWVMFSKGYQSGDGITVIIGEGEIELSVNQLRLYLAPAYSRVYTPQQINDAPEIVREMIASENKPITIEEYRLDSNVTYYAHVDSESYWLPPEDDKPPTRHANHVLAISDLPFKDNESQRPLTPAYQGWSY